MRWEGGRCWTRHFFEEARNEKKKKADSSQKKREKKSEKSLFIVCALKEERDERQRRDDDDDDEQKRGKGPAAFVSKRVQRKFSVRISKSFVFFFCARFVFSLISPVEEASVFV